MWFQRQKQTIIFIISVTQDKRKRKVKVYIMNGRRASMSTRRGWLLKRGGLFKSKFQKRYFILRGNELQRYQNDKLAAEGPSKAKALIKMEGVADVRPAENENGKLPDYAIDIYFIDGKMLTLCAENNTDMLAWIKAFNAFVFVQQKANAKSVIEGPLEHSLDHGKTWTMCYVVLNPDRILVYDKLSQEQQKQNNNQRGEPISVLTFTDEFYCSDGTGGQWAFQISDFDITYYFNAPDAEHQMFWMHAIARIIRKLRAEREHANSVIDNQFATSSTAENPMLNQSGNRTSQLVRQQSAQELLIGKTHDDEEDNEEDNEEEIDLSQLKPGTAQLLYDFQAESKGEISVPVDEFVILIEKLDEDFWVVDYNGVKGFVQNDYMEILKPLEPKRAVKRASLKARRESNSAKLKSGPSPGPPPGAPPSHHPGAPPPPPSSLSQDDEALKRKQEKEEQEEIEKARLAEQARIEALEKARVEEEKRKAKEAEEEARLAKEVEDLRIKASEEEKKIQELKEAEKKRQEQLEIERKKQEEEEKERLRKAEEAKRKAEEERRRLSDIEKKKAEEEAKRLEEENAEKERLRKEAEAKREAERRKADEVAKAAKLKEEQRLRELREAAEKKALELKKRQEEEAALLKKKKAEEERLAKELAAAKKKKEEEEALAAKKKKEEEEAKALAKIAKDAADALKGSSSSPKDNAERKKLASKRRSIISERRKSKDLSAPGKKKIKGGARRGGGNLKNRLAMWQKKTDDYANKQKNNIFSSKYTGPKAGGKVKIDTKAADYGKPKEGSKTAARAAKAKEWVKKEIKKLLEVIVKIGGKDDEGMPCIEFGPLFIAYQDISDTLVGILMRSKKYKYLEYKGDMLFQGCHDKVMITLKQKGVDRANEKAE